MDITLLILIVMVFIAAVAAFWVGGWRLIISGLKQGGHMIRLVWLRLLLGIIIGGLVQVLIPAELIVEWIGPASGVKGILIGSYLGIILTGGPYVQVPIIASIYKSGAAAGPIIALLAAGNVLSLQLLFTWYLPFFGIRLNAARYIACVVALPVIGLVGGAVFWLLTAF